MLIKLLLFANYVGLGSLMSVKSSKKGYFMDESGLEKDVVNLLSSKAYLPNEKYLQKNSLIKSSGNDATYLLSKLSDEELLKLLNEQPNKTDYDLNDIVKIAFDTKYVQDVKPKLESVARNANVAFANKNMIKKKYRGPIDKNTPQVAFFRLENKQVDPYSIKSDSDQNYNAALKLKNMLYSRPQIVESEVNPDDEEDKKKELLFDVLVAQLKMLCCKKKPVKYNTKHRIIDELPFTDKHSQDHKSMANEHMFLIINDEIKSNETDELISVDPNSLERNTSVLLLGPITTPLTDFQLKLVMSRISNELSKPEYLPLLQQLSEGSLSANNANLMKSLVTGPETRRYIKPHRCNHQSKLARIYGGPKWLICTGYLNLNTPSLYD